MMRTDKTETREDSTQVMPHEGQGKKKTWKRLTVQELEHWREACEKAESYREKHKTKEILKAGKMRIVISY